MHAAQAVLARGRIDRAADDSSDGVDAETLRQTAHAIGQRVAVDVGKEGGDIQRGDSLGVGVGLVRYRAHRGRRIVDWAYGDGHRLNSTLARSRIHHCVGEAVRTVIVQVRRIDVAAVWIDDDCAVRRIACFSKVQAAAACGAVVASDASGHGRVFIRRGAVVGCAQVRDRANCDGHGLNSAFARGRIRHCVGEAVRTVVVGIGSVSICTVRIDDDGAVRRIARLGEGEGAAARCAIIASDASGHGRVFIRCSTVVCSNQVERRINSDDKICVVGAAFAVADRVGHGRHDAVPIGVGSEGVGAVAAEGEATDADYGDNVARAVESRIAGYSKAGDT